MAKIQTSALINDIKGVMGGSIFQGSTGGLIVKRKNNGAIKNTPAFQQAQVNLAKVTSAYKKLAPAQRNAWANMVNLYQSHDVWNNPRNKSGFELFSSVNIKRAAMGLPIQADPVAPAVLPDFQRWGVATYDLPLYSPQSFLTPIPLGADIDDPRYDDYKGMITNMQIPDVDLMTLADGPIINLSLNFVNLYAWAKNAVMNDSFGYSGMSKNGTNLMVGFLSADHGRVDLRIGISKGEDSISFMKRFQFDELSYNDCIAVSIPVQDVDSTIVRFNGKKIETSVSTDGDTVNNFDSLNFSVLPIIMQGVFIAAIYDGVLLSHEATAQTFHAVAKGYIPEQSLFIFNYSEKSLLLFNYAIKENIELLGFADSFPLFARNKIKKVNLPFLAALASAEDIGDFKVRVNASYASIGSRAARSNLMKNIGYFDFSDGCAVDIAQTYFSQMGTPINGSTLYFQLEAVNPQTGQTIKLPMTDLGTLDPVGLFGNDDECNDHDDCPTDEACVGGCCQAWGCWPLPGELSDKVRPKFKVGTDLETTVRK